jgi:hypothetical protein
VEEVILEELLSSLQDIGSLDFGLVCGLVEAGECNAGLLSQELERVSEVQSSLLLEVRYPIAGPVTLPAPPDRLIRVIGEVLASVSTKRTIGYRLPALLLWPLEAGEELALVAAAEEDIVDMLYIGIHLEEVLLSRLPCPGLLFLLAWSEIGDIVRVLLALLVRVWKYQKPSGRRDLAREIGLAVLALPFPESG